MLTINKIRKDKKLYAPMHVSRVNKPEILLTNNIIWLLTTLNYFQLEVFNLDLENMYMKKSPLFGMVYLNVKSYFANLKLN